MRTLLLAAQLAVLALPAAARDAVLVKASGKVWVKAEGTEKYLSVKEGAQLLYGDSVRVGKRSIAQLSLGEKAAVLVREDSEFLIGGTAEQTELDFSFGEFLVGLRQKLGLRQSFRVRTPTAVAAIRGTLFWGKADKKTKSTTYAGFGGKVVVEAQGRMVEVTPGTTVTVAFGQPPSQPAPSTVTLDYAGKFMVDGTLQGLEALAAEPAPAAAPQQAPAPQKAPAPKKRRGKKPDAEPEPK
ncbi:hypothetical protein EPO15_11315 [bacterium]|nr:MAG: hypothetical protein EPO15_11315 [bacterium]